jgi:hypothetical protein
MQLIIDIKNESIADKIKTILSAFKHDGVEIKETLSTEPKIKESKPEADLSDEYMEKHWRELVMTKGDYSDYYKSDQYYEDRAKAYNSKEMI